MFNYTKQLLVLLVLFSLPLVSHAKLEIFACEPEWAELSQSLAGEKANVFSATHAGQDPHHIQARPSLIAKLRKADLAICTGAGLEAGWMPMLQRRARNPKVLPGNEGYFEATEQVTLLEKPANLDRAEGDIHGDGNPHIHIDPRRILKVAKSFSSRLQTIDPENKPHYQVKLEEFENQFQDSMNKWQEQAIPLKGKQVIVHHREWVYLLDWLGMVNAGSLEPKPGIPPSLEHLAQLKKLPAELIIISPLNSDKPSKWLNEQTGAPVVILPHTVNALPDTNNFIELFSEIIRRLLEKVNA